jgi:hypothetical protein
MLWVAESLSAWPLLNEGHVSFSWALYTKRENALRIVDARIRGRAGHGKLAAAGMPPVYHKVWASSPWMVEWVSPTCGALNSAVECHLHTVEVIGSNPVAPTIKSITCSVLARLSAQLRQIARWAAVVARTSPEVFRASDSNGYIFGATSYSLSVNRRAGFAPPSA